MYPGQNVVTGGCRLQYDVPDEHRSASIGSPADSIREPSTRDPHAHWVVVRSSDQFGVVSAID